MNNVNQKNEIKLQSHTKTSIKQKIDLIVAGTVDHQKLSIEGMVDIFNAFKNSDSDSVIKFKNVLNKIINE